MVVICLSTPAKNSRWTYLSYSNASSAYLTIRPNPILAANDSPAFGLVGTFGLFATVSKGLALTFRRE